MDSSMSFPLQKLLNTMDLLKKKISRFYRRQHAYSITPTCQKPTGKKQSEWLRSLATLSLLHPGIIRVLSHFEEAHLLGSKTSGSSAAKPPSLFRKVTGNGILDLLEKKESPLVLRTTTPHIVSLEP
ncbi:hypothetical protein O181_006387 [Austropuccinia psidii MF-1]|uniref:Uncharacterized protein n=1 Tax=Austropuccinia psidii MF-1 TaxID=1389203 RepID=A0A9Q3BJY8_9BASI|nr:hypothetical protein [Austropuccinia psidii MF-1]